jgi:hypothetical protein
MTDEKWLDTKSTIKEKFEIIEEGKEDLDEMEGRGYREFVIFNGPLGKMKIERTIKALVLGKKTFGSKRIGNQATVEYIYSDTETTSKFKAYKWDNSSENWIEITIGDGL